MFSSPYWPYASLLLLPSWKACMKVPYKFSPSHRSAWHLGAGIDLVIGTSIEFQSERKVTHFDQQNRDACGKHAHLPFLCNHLKMGGGRRDLLYSSTLLGFSIPSPALDDLSVERLLTLFCFSALVWKTSAEGGGRCLIRVAWSVPFCVCQVFSWIFFLCCCNSCTYVFCQPICSLRLITVFLP